MGNNCLCFCLHLLEMFLTQERFGIDFVLIFSAGRTSGEPGIFRRYLEAANSRTVAGRLG